MFFQAIIYQTFFALPGVAILSAIFFAIYFIVRKANGNKNVILKQSTPNITSELFGCAFYAAIAYIALHYFFGNRELFSATLVGSGIIGGLCLAAALATEKK